MGAQETKSLSLFFLTILASITVQRVTSEDYTLGVLLPYSNNVPGKSEQLPAKYYAAAVAMAVDRVNSDPNLLRGSRLSYVWNNTQCNHTKMVEQQHWQIKHGVNGFIGPECHARKAAKVAAKKGLAVISYGSPDPHVSNKKLYPNFGRTSPSDYKAVLKITELLKARRWSHVTIVCQTGRRWRSFQKYLSRHLSQLGITVGNVIVVDDNLAGSNEHLESVIPAIKSAMNSRSQATIFVLSIHDTREIMSILEGRQLLEPNPEHGYIGMLLDELLVNNLLEYPFKWFFSAYHFYSPKMFERTERAFKRLLMVTMKSNPGKTEGHKLFEMELKRRTSQEPFNCDVYKGCSYFLNGRCLFDKSTSVVPFTGIYLYHAVIQFAEALHQVVTAQEKPTGRNIINNLKGKQFVGIDGYKHDFDQNADVEYEYTVLGLKKDSKNRSNMLPLESLEN